MLGVLAPERHRFHFEPARLQRMDQRENLKFKAPPLAG